MSKRPPTAIAVLLGLLALLALPAPASAAEPWWSVETGSRPSNLPPAPDATEVQKLTTMPFEGNLTVTVSVGGEPLGCLGAGSGVFFCKGLTGFDPTTSAAGLEALLEGPYGPEVEVSEEKPSDGPPGAVAFLIATPGRWVSPVTITPTPLITQGDASVTATSEGSGRLLITATNLGDAPLDATGTPLEIVEELPGGVLPYGAEAFAGVADTAGPVECTIPQSADSVACRFEGELPSYAAIEVEVLVALSPGAAGEAEIAIAGGDAEPAGTSHPIAASAAPVAFGLERFSAGAEAQGGGTVEAPGSRPFQLSNTVQFNSGVQTDKRFEETAVFEQPAQPRDTAVTFPPGLVGSATAVPRCPMALFLALTILSNACPAETAVGVASVTIREEVLGLVRVAVPIFNIAPAHGQPARFGFVPVGTPVVVDTAVDPEEDYRITGEVRNAGQTVSVFGATLSLWGVPGDPRHDGSRGWDCVPYSVDVALDPPECNPPATRDETPFLRMPVSCGEPLGFEAAAEPWNAPAGSAPARASAAAPPLRGCSGVPFDPAISNSLTSRLAANPSGLDFELSLPGQWPANPANTAEAQPKKVEVTLPEGVTINPSQAEGLATCDPDDYARERYDSRPGEGCPEASKIGSVEVSTPLLEEKATGSLYVATPYENPSNSLIALYLVAKIPERGVLVKQAGKVEPDPRTGRLVSTFDDIPQVPFDSFKLHFREGGRSPLITPPGCGSFETVARFTPWSASDPDRPRPDEIVERTATMSISRGPDGGACPRGKAPFEPGFEAGTLGNQAGSYSPFAMRLTRQDGEQDLSKFSAVLPPGVVGKVAGIPWCPEQGIARARARSGKDGGAEELRDPSCPAPSAVGRTVAGAGVGNQLTYVGGSLYLAGPYNGAPLSVVSITPAVAGPFDAGVVVVRVALDLDPRTAVVEVDGSASDPIPHILKGIPLNVRDLRVYADRPAFTLNATSCEEGQTIATLWGAGTALDPSFETPVARAARYQAAGCSALGFKPRLAIELKGGAKRGAHPALRAVVRPRPGQANFSRAVVTLPNSAFLEQAHIRTICTRVQFNSPPGNGANCPEGAQYGYARAWSPLLDGPVQGPVYLRSSDNKLPDLVLALTGPPSAPFAVELSARIDSVKGGIRSTFAAIPDVPVSRFALNMQGGRKGLIVNSRHLCHKPKRNRAKANLKGQNGRLARSRPVVRSSACAKAKRRQARRAQVSEAQVAPEQSGR